MPTLPIRVLLALAASAVAVAQPPVIPDEPRAIDAAPFLPRAITEPVTADFTEESIGELAEWLQAERGRRGGAAPTRSG